PLPLARPAAAGGRARRRPRGRAAGGRPRPPRVRDRPPADRERLEGAPAQPPAGIGAVIRQSPAGVGAFNVIQLEHATAIVAGAEALGVPVVLQISENCVRYHGALEPVALAALAVARRASVPVAVHLDHATDRALVEEAVALGLGSVMFDASALPDRSDERRVGKERSAAR